MVCSLTLHHGMMCMYPPQASMINHSCVPNCTLSLSLSLSLTLLSRR